MIEGQLRLDRAAPPPWTYRGTLFLPSGRAALIEARVAQDAAGKFFELRANMIPGLSDAEIEAALAECERAGAAAARAEFEADTNNELPF
jgi:hypothetical protein